VRNLTKEQLRDIALKGVEARRKKRGSTSSKGKTD